MGSSQPQAFLGPLTEAAGLPDDGRHRRRGGGADCSPTWTGCVRTVGFRGPGAGELRRRHRLRRSGTGCSAGRARRACTRSASCRGRGHTRGLATPGDLLFHIRAPALDLCFELATRWSDRLPGRPQSSTRSTASGTSTTATCSASSTAPRIPTRPGRSDATIIGDEDPPFAGGSYVIVQKYLHDLDAWNALPIEAQERIIGRTKLDNIELDDAVKPSNSHVVLTTVIDDDGDELKILRPTCPSAASARASSGPTSSATPRSPDVTEQMLRNMFIGDPRATTTASSTSTERSRRTVLRADRGLPGRSTWIVIRPGDGD